MTYKNRDFPDFFGNAPYYGDVAETQEKLWKMGGEPYAALLHTSDMQVMIDFPLTEAQALQAKEKGASVCRISRYLADGQPVALEWI